MLLSEDASPVAGVALALRVIGLALPGVLLVASTDPVRLADALTLHWRVPPRFAYGALAALRLVPLLVAEFESVRLARRTRGVEAGRNPVAAARLFAGMAFTLLVGALRRGSRLATAMDARGFDSGVPRTNARGRCCAARDAVFVVGTVVVCAAAIALSVLTGPGPDCGAADGGSRARRYGPAVTPQPPATSPCSAGINLGKARQVAMPRLRELLTARGHEDVRTHLRSGNVVLDSRADEAELAADLARRSRRSSASPSPSSSGPGGDRRRGRRRPVRHRGDRPGALPGDVHGRGAGPGRAWTHSRRPRAAATTWCGAASSTCGCPTVSRTRRWPPGSGTGSSAGPDGAQLEHRGPAGGARRLTAPDRCRHPTGGDTRRRRFGSGQRTHTKLFGRPSSAVT